MSQFKNGHETVAKYHGTRALAAVYKGLQLIWMGVRSCFGSGIWVQAKPWLGSEKWKNNK